MLNIDIFKNVQLNKNKIKPWETCLYKLTNRFLSACSEWIPNISRYASTAGHMIPHITLGINTTCSGARINTFVPLTRLVGRTIRVDNAFRPTRDIGVTKSFWVTLTGSCSVTVGTESVGSTRRRITRVYNFSWCRN